MNYEEIREKYNPTRQNIKVKVLFIGESPPKSTFFYCANSKLYSATKEAFEKAYGRKIPNSLQCFMLLGCYLIDLYNEPGRKAKKLCGLEVYEKEKEELIQRLASQIAQFNPHFIIAVHENVCSWSIISAIEALEILKERDKTPNFNLNAVRCLPFPKNCERGKQAYVGALVEIIKEMMQKNILPRELPKMH
ncbi:hypothetical protein [Methanotorris igneus]|uniref:Uracil-DNA glycosylase-like domain-containing protein n=1 Tax=Methanotorris igneus (strain DSM 5666 / JCM 11834 / Kol 5) TaxID=880724 RepID=F6BBI5_METIK|nr:hypothetical protein [Methanotorris igneus]AEF95994.1 hypothetical protein Metig_0438 [Methanotorris igneus Kol 5]